MCGIAGILTTNGEPPSRRQLETMNDALAHRGPDGAHLWFSKEPGCGLAHRRLAILDVAERADQPMLSHDGRYAIVFNGEIYNFLEVRAELEAKGRHFHTEGDVEVALAGWQAWGADVLYRLNGMWAFGLYDNQTKELVLCRDRFGVKPLLYSARGNRVAFASEARALLTLPWVSGELDPEIAKRSVYDPFSIEASARTIHRDIERLPAGHLLRIRGAQRTLTRWWRTTDHLPAPPSSLAEAAPAFLERFQSAVRLRMRSDVPIGSCLSGGFDSTAIVSAMRLAAEAPETARVRENDDWRHAFIASFPGMLNDETAEAKVAAAYADIKKPTLIDFSGDDPLNDLEAVLDSLEDIFIGLPTAVWKIYRAVNASGVRVSLDGHGADEMMGAYRQGGEDFMFSMANLFGTSGGRPPAVLSSKDFLKAGYLRSRGQYFLRGLGPPPIPPIAALSDPMPKGWGILNRRLYTMFHATVLPTLLRNFDRLSMAHSVEVRSPFIDWRLVVFVMSLPDAMKSDNRYSKLIAREALKGRMPETIRTATRKVGFGSQMPEWLNGGLGGWAQDLLTRPDSFYDEIVDRKRLLARVRSLNASKTWDWAGSGRLWPYIHLRWQVDRQARQCASQPVLSRSGSLDYSLAASEAGP